MRVSVIGCGYLGAVHAAAMAELGHQVTGVDVDAERVGALARGEAPFYEPGFPELLRASIASGRLTFTTDPGGAAAEVCFLCVGTPQVGGSGGAGGSGAAGTGAADLSFLDAAVTGLGPVLGGETAPVVVGKSTVPVGTARQVAAALGRTAPHAALVWNPEFLREGLAVRDSLAPDRIVYGLADRASRPGADTLDRVYADLLARGIPKIETDYETAELVKVSANSFLALKISFINAVAEACDQAGANVRDLAQAIGHDARIGAKFLGAGIGFGGGCLPKDLRAFAARADQLGADDLTELLHLVDRINLGQRTRLADRVSALIGPDLRGCPIAVLGAAFKPGTDDTRDSPALAIAADLAGRGADIRIYDPAARGGVLGVGLTPAASVSEAASGAEAVLLLTEWPEFGELDPGELARTVARPVIFDGRNQLDPARWRQAGWTYIGIGGQ